MSPELSDYAKRQKPSAIRVAGIEFRKRNDVKDVSAINVAIGNVSLDLHKAIDEKAKEIINKGKLKCMYTPSVGLDEINQTWLHLINSGGYNTEGLYAQTTIGGSDAMNLLIRATCGNVKGEKRPLMLIDPAYTNYMGFADANQVDIVSITRNLGDDGKFTLPEISEIEKTIQEHKPNAIVVIPYDNPTGQFYTQKQINDIAKLCVKYDMWMISDEAYRELNYTENEMSSIWGIDTNEIPEIKGSRISIETASKVWNGCGLRMGALVTDNQYLKVAEENDATKMLCPSRFDQLFFSGLLEESKEDLQKWYQNLRDYYKPMMTEFREEMMKELPGVIVSQPEASLYAVIDVRKIAPEFDAKKFVDYCSTKGKVDVDGQDMTLLVAPMEGFYNKNKELGKTQMRVAFIETPENMKIVPKLFAALYKQHTQ